MKKLSTLLAALLFASVSVAYAATSGQGATQVQDNLTDNHSKGAATTGLNNAEKHITATHGKSEKLEGKTEKAEHATKVDRPMRPERPGR